MTVVGQQESVGRSSAA